MFFGETAINLDAKGRLAIPMRYRDAIQDAAGGQLVLTYSAFDNGALYLFPKEKWEAVRDEVMKLSTYEPRHRSLQRKLVGSASTVEPDANGRIQIPLTLRQVAGLEKRVVMLGMGERFEIWNEGVLNSTRLEDNSASEDSPTEEMTRLVF
ncbi:MAG: division/cell wall cluster transcriptional repressor MraZ [Lysobacterales bacterium]